MRQQILNNENKRWLKDNFRDLEDTAICAYLSKEQKKANAREAKRLEGILPTLTSDERTRVKRRIRSLLAFSEISINTMRGYARRLGCGRKRGIHITQVRRRASMRHHTERWDMMAEEVDDLTKWLRSFGRNDVKVIRLSDRRSERTVRQTASRMNRNEGEKTNRYFSVECFVGYNFAVVRSRIYNTL